MSAVIWVHADALSRDHPVFAAAPKDARPIYIWDADDVARRDWSLKRCVFVLECLAEMDVDILRGPLLETLQSLETSEIFAAKTPDPEFKDVLQALGNKTIVVAPKTFVSVPDGTDMGRFFRYWNKAKRSALNRH